jgi:hypothetical protein
MTTNNVINSPLPTTVANGGTGNSSLTAYAPLFGGTTTTGAVQSSSVGTINQILTSSGSGVLPAMQWPNNPNRYSITRAYEFINGGANANNDYTIVVGNSGTGSGGANASQSFSTSGAVLGVASFATGTTTTGVCGISMDANTSESTAANVPFYLGGGIITLEFCTLGVSALSNNTDTYTLWFGWGYSSGGQIIDDVVTYGVYFVYTNGTNSGNWVGSCTDPGGTSSTNGSTGPVVAGAQTLKIIINAAATSVSFYINDVLMGSPVTNNIPAAQPLSPYCTILKSAGTTSRLVYIDSARYEVDFTSPR